MYVVECEPDAVLVKCLAATSKKDIIHAGNKPELLKKLVERYTYSKGMIDEDPWSYQPPLLSRFKEKQSTREFEIKIFNQRSRNNVLIMLCPRLEEWILKAAKEANVKPEDFSLPNDPEELHRIINIRTDNFEKFIKNIKDKSDRLKMLAQHLRSIF
ncbi:MAG: hypothetical protein QXL38_03025 [Candidatus Bathyarchaeia archaeon]